MKKLLKLSFTLAFAVAFVFSAGTALAQNNNADIEQVSGASGLVGSTAKQVQKGSQGTAWIRQLNSPNGGMEAVQKQFGYSAKAEALQNGSKNGSVYQEQHGNNFARTDQIDSPNASSDQRQWNTSNVARVDQRDARRSTAKQRQRSYNNTADIIQRAPSMTGGPAGNTAIQIQN